MTTWKINIIVIVVYFNVRSHKLYRRHMQRHTIYYCCHRDQGPHRGDWYFPNNTVLGFLFDNPDDNIRELRSAQQVEIHHRNIGTAPTGIYRCSIETNSVNRDIEGNRVRERVYIGLYTSAGNYTSTLL